MRFISTIDHIMVLYLNQLKRFRMEDYRNHKRARSSDLNSILWSENETHIIFYVLLYIYIYLQNEAVFRFWFSFP